MTKGKTIDNLKYKKSLTVKGDVISEKIIIKNPKENSNYKFSRVWIFSLGFLIIIFSEITSPLTVRDFLYFKLSLVLPFIIFIIQYIFLFNIINRYKKNYDS